ncbi:MAG: 2-succinyl-6-hydroxy-2,4-cyclohexadiene-1-carboxylate synthase [Acidimicrobiia bacterium]|nr:MAG: 2-succinyl-6-hydroxy-2,4-cyclohexadiene-1-carboxylate synthase [Acidimicrobiia bacterium]
MLHVRRFGSGPPLVALHGFTLTGAQFESAATLLSRTIHAPDLPGHGFSAGESADFSTTVSTVASMVSTFGGETPLLGYSMGARIALGVAIDQPESVPALIVISGTPGIDEATQRNKRIVSDAALLETLRRQPVEEFLETWTSTGITDTSHLQDSVRATDRIVRGQNTSSGLADALAGLGQGVQPSLWSQLDRLTMSVLLVHGERDAKYTEVARRMSQSIPDCHVIQIATAGHNPLLDDPEETYGEISAFLDGLG